MRFMLSLGNKYLPCRYNQEESSTAFDADNSLFFFGDEASFQKKEAELAKKLVTTSPASILSLQ